MGDCFSDGIQELWGRLVAVSFCARRWRGLPISGNDVFLVYAIFRSRKSWHLGNEDSLSHSGFSVFFGVRSTSSPAIVFYFGAASWVTHARLSVVIYNTVYLSSGLFFPWTVVHSVHSFFNACTTSGSTVCSLTGSTVSLHSFVTVPSF